MEQFFMLKVPSRMISVAPGQAKIALNADQNQNNISPAVNVTVPITAISKNLDNVSFAAITNGTTSKKDLHSNGIPKEFKVNPESSPLNSNPSDLEKPPPTNSSSKEIYTISLLETTLQPYLPFRQPFSSEYWREFQSSTTKEQVIASLQKSILLDQWLLSEVKHHATNVFAEPETEIIERCGWKHFELWNLTRHVMDLERAVGYFRTLTEFPGAKDGTPLITEPRRAEILDGLMKCYRHLYDSKNIRNFLEHAIDTGEECVGLPQCPRDTRETAFWALMDCLIAQYEWPNQTPIQLKAIAIRLFQVVQKYITEQEGHKDSYTEVAESYRRLEIPAKTLEAIASILHTHYKLHPNVRRPNDIVAGDSQSLEKSKKSPPSADVLDMAILFQRYALDRVNPLSMEKLHWGVSLSLMLTQRHQRKRSEETQKDIEEAAKLCTDAATNCDDWDAEKQAHLQSVLAKPLELLWDRRDPKSLAHLDSAILLLTNAVTTGRALLRSGRQLVDGDKILDVPEWTADLERLFILKMQYHLDMMGQCLGIEAQVKEHWDEARKVEAQVMEHTNEALKANEKIAEGERWVGKAQVLLTRAKVKYLRFQTNYEKEEDRQKQLNEAIEQGIQALNTATSPQEGNDSLVALNIRDALATFYLARYVTFGDVDDLKTAEKYARKCVKRLEKDRNTAETTSLYPQACNSLAAILVQRYKLNYARGDLDSAIEYESKAVERSYSDGLVRATYMVTLSQYLEILSELQWEDPEERRAGGRAGETLDKAIRLIEQVWKCGLLEAHGDQLKRLALRNTIASLYSEKYKREGKSQLDKLEEVLSRAQQGVDNKEFRGVDKVAIFSTLSEAYSLSEKEGALQKALYYAEEALKRCPESRFQRAELEYQLGVLQGKSVPEDKIETELEKELDRILDPLTKCIYRETSPPTFRLKAAVHACSLLEKAARLTSSTKDQKARRWRQLYDIGKKAMEILPLLGIKALPMHDQLKSLKDISGLGSTAAAAALELGTVPIWEALSLLEQGRDVVAGNRFDTRADLTALRSDLDGLQLAERFEALREELDPAGVSVRLNLRADSRSTEFGQSSKELEGITTKLLNANEKFQKLLQEIRARKGLEDFLKPPNESVMKSAAHGGTVVVVNVTGWRCDAFIVREDKDIDFCKLPKLTQEDVRNYLQGDPNENSSIPTVDVSSSEVLAWIWDSIAEPVLHDFLKYEEEYDLEKLTKTGPRVWWIMTGETSRLPVHAGASDGAKSDPMVVSKRVVSSYATSIKSLLFSRKQLARRVEDKATRGKHALLCGLMTTKYDEAEGLRPVDSAESETQAIKEVLEKDKTIDVMWWTTKSEPSADAVCNALSPPSTPTPSMFHFSGHGKSSRTDPSSSAIFLYDKHLDVATLLRARVFTATPILAYLSACSTGTTTLEPDEGVTMMSGFISAGFMNVIGTLWDVDDIISKTVAISMYKRWMETGREPDGLAGCLHWAVETMKEDGITDNGNLAQYWACFTHMGV